MMRRKEIYQSLCLLMIASSFLVGVVSCKDESLLTTYKRLVLNMFLRDNDAAGTHPATVQRQPLLVIGAGLGRTSTSSFTKALARLGLKSYHMDEVMEHADHLKLWAEHARRQKINASDFSLLDQILDKLAQDGYNATADFPSIVLHQEFLHRYPKARVVLTVRNGNNGAASWAKSVNQTLLTLTQSMCRIPWSWTPTVNRFYDMASWFFPAVGIALMEDPHSPNKFLYPPMEQLEDAYRDWNHRVMTWVPRDKLLVFAASDGYGPLCEFLSPVSPSVETNCQQVLASQESYPYGNSTSFMKGLYYFMSCVSVLFEWGGLVLAALLLVVGIRRRWASKGKQD